MKKRVAVLHLLMAATIGHVAGNVSPPLPFAELNVRLGEELPLESCHQILHQLQVQAR
jgi:hypothetical protein